MTNLDLYNKVREVPQEAKKQIQCGRLKGKTDINPMWRIKVLTEQFGPCGAGWYYKVIDKTKEQVKNEVAVFVDIELYIKQDNEWSMPIYGTGGSMLATDEKNGIYVSDECYKMATTDAISVACKQLGIGADVYFESDKSKYEKISQESFISESTLINLFKKELIRTGVPATYFFKLCNVSEIEKMGRANIEQAIEGLALKPNKT